ncbi:MAG: diguanylate cyclase [Deltaproteobacteria bacterium]|nr:diguanylate cyclase [Candidatus Zymogenaceae bacterium]
MAVKTRSLKTLARGSGTPDSSAGASPPSPPLGTSDELITPEIKKYRSMLDENPTSRVFAPLGELYRKRGMYDEAIGLCLKGLKHHPDYLSGRVVLGLAYFDKGMIREAAEQLERVVSAKPDHLMAAKALGDVLLMSGDVQRAKYCFERVLALAPDDLDIKKKLEPMTSEHDSAAEQVRQETAEPPVAPVPVPDEIIEGEGLEIVEADSPVPDVVPEARIIRGEEETLEINGIDLSADEMSDILVNAEQQIYEIETMHTSPGTARTPPGPVPAPTGGVLPLYRAIEHLQIGIVITDLDGTVHYVNRAAAETHGYTKDEPVGRNIRELFPPRLFQPMTMHEILGKRSFAKDTMNVRKDGSIFPVRITYDVIEDDSRQPIYIIFGMDDLTRRKDVDEDLWQSSIKDAETGLYNRRHFLFKITEEAKRAERIGYPLCLMILTISNFNSYQTASGPKKGQRVAVELAKIVQQSTRKELDSAYRLTDDEFAVILPTATDAKALVVAGRLVEKAVKRFPNIEIKIGTASRQDHRSVEGLIDAAEKAAIRATVGPAEERTSSS